MLFPVIIHTDKPIVYIMQSLHTHMEMLETFCYAAPIHTVFLWLAKTSQSRLM